MTTEVKDHSFVVKMLYDRHSIWTLYTKEYWLPILPLIKDGVIYKFLLDNTCGDSYIFEDIAESIPDDPNVKLMNMTLCPGYYFKDNVYLTEKDDNIKSIEKRHFIELHGIIGSRAMAWNRMVIDYGKEEIRIPLTDK